MKLPRSLLLLPLLLLTIAQPAQAHVGSKDIFETANAGPYQLFVTIRMPNVIPGEAVVETRSSGAPITGIRITPLPLTGEASLHPPTSDPMKVSVAARAFYTGTIWIMASGSWQVRFEITGPYGTHTTSVPVPATAVSTLRMDRALGTILALLGLFLVLSMAGLVAAAIREARLSPGLQPDATRRRRAAFAMFGSLAVMAFAVYLGAKWWNVEAAAYNRNIFRPLQMTSLLNGNQLTLTVDSHTDPEDPRVVRSNKDFIPDHGHLMHLYLIRQPGLDAVYHLHPTQTTAGTFSLNLPSMPQGDYKLYADVVHANGFPETLLATLTIPSAITVTPVVQTYSNGRPKPVNSDDASALAPPISATPLGNSFRLPDGYTMVWDPPASLTAGTPYNFHFSLLDANGKPASDMQPYMGMAGHAAFVKTDGTVFAHVHPDGSAAMAAVMIANPPPADAMADMPDMTGMSHPPGIQQDPNANTVSFPYGFPTPGSYRIFVQMKHNTTVETGVFDANVQ
jgi:hypothetical protein